MSGRELTWDERILSQMKPGVDPTLVAESLRLTPSERLARLQGMLDFVELIRPTAPSDHAVSRTARDPQPR